MKRLQISLEHELDEELSRAARRAGVSKAEVVRRSLRKDIRPRLPLAEDPFFQMLGSLDAEGKGLRPGESIDDVVYGRKARDGLR